MFTTTTTTHTKGFLFQDGVVTFLTLNNASYLLFNKEYLILCLNIYYISARPPQIKGAIDEADHTAGTSLLWVGTPTCHLQTSSPYQSSLMTAKSAEPAFVPNQSPDVLPPRTMESSSPEMATAFIALITPSELSCSRAKAITRYPVHCS